MATVRRVIGLSFTCYRQYFLRKRFRFLAVYIMPAGTDKFHHARKARAFLIPKQCVSTGYSRT